MDHRPDSILAKLGTLLVAPGGMLAGWAGTADPAVAEALVRAGFPAVILDMQHGAYDVTQCARAVSLLALAGAPAIVRIPVDDYQTASRVLDAGAAGILAPMINTAADAARLAAFSKYPPLGKRSWGPGRVLDMAGLGGAAYLAAANGLHKVFAMIETPEGLGNLDAILAVAGIDGVYVGPSDLSIGLTGGRVVDPLHADVDRALDHVAARAHAAGKHAGLFTFDGLKAREMVKRGFTLTSISTDMLLLKAAARAELAAARGTDATG